ncbi:EAL domain-containing protein [Marinobacter sp.]|uniref:bifunctional diguanylate cyclase/phosphodiesterase n=1 Tax=Marinobacter sp. TaxID=50741 RepID=UPI001B557A7A|nr:EAL domain-containing protein [Marinobacter sp.]MBQ0834702.1 EAL domain-containing protein [Marinobacter sp.]
MKKGIVVSRSHGSAHPGAEVTGQTDSLDPSLKSQLTVIATLAQHSFGVDTVSLSVPGTLGLGIKSEPELPNGQSSCFDRVCVIEDALKDPAFSEALLIPDYSDTRFYAELAVRAPNDLQIALICLMHSQPKRFGELERKMFQLFGSIIRNALANQTRRQQPSIETPSLVQSISQTQDLFLNSTDCKSACNHLLRNILSLTNSQMGLIGEVRQNPLGESSLKLLALSGEPQCPHGIALLQGIRNEGMVFKHLDNLLGAAVSQGKVVISKNVTAESKHGGLPKGHPAMTTYMGIPVFSGQSVIGLIGLADRPEGYTEKLADELRPLSQTVGMLVERHRLHAEKVRSNRRVERARNYDHLTCLPSGPMLTKLFRREVRETIKWRRKLSVCMIDIDDFKHINDQYGHAIGDDVLKTIAIRLKRALRSKDLVAKLRGDEFLVTLRGIDSPSIYRRLLDVISEPITSSTQTLVLSASMGVTVYPHDQSEPDILLRHASHALYDAKESGKGQFVTFDVSVHQARQERIRILEDIESSLERSQFQLFYQPKINFRSGIVEGFEALIRWNHPEHGLLMPNEFLGATELTKYESILGDFVIRTALSALQQFEANHQNYTVSINISPHHFLNNNFISVLQAHLRGCSTQLRRRLVLEVLESTAIEDVGTAKNTVKACQALGVTVSLDDFGTGFSSLTYFRDLPVDEIKIDKSFVIGMLENPSDRVIVESIISLSKRFNRRVVAEGVETKALAQELRGLNCDFGQGYYFSAPQPLEQAIAWADRFSNPLFKNGMQ